MMSIFLVLLEPDANQEDRQYNRVLSIVTVKSFVKSCQGYTALVMIPESGIPIIYIHTHTHVQQNHSDLSYQVSWQNEKDNAVSMLPEPLYSQGRPK